MPHLVELTWRVTNGLYLLQPTYEFRQVVYGVLAKAQDYQPIDLHHIVAPSSHLHLLCSVHNQGELSRFARYFAGNLAKEIGKYHGWHGRVWSRRYSGILVDDDEITQLQRLRYLLENCVKERLVDDPLEWPGVSTAVDLYQGRRQVEGGWINRTRKYRGSLRGIELTDQDVTEKISFELTTLPCWQHLDRDERVARAREMIDEIKREARGRNKKEGKKPLGVEKLRYQNPMQSSENLDLSWGPMFHARQPRLNELWAAYRQFLASFLHASDQYRKGNCSPEDFPLPCFVPSLGYLCANARAPD